jgi:hypothetical protein
LYWFLSREKEKKKKVIPQCYLFRAVVVVFV